MISINDELLRRVSSDFDIMLNATIKRMKEHFEDKAEVTLKLTIEMTKESISKEEEDGEIDKILVDVPHFSHKVKSKWTGGKDFEGAIIEPLYLIGNDKEEYHLIRRKDAQISMFEED